MTQSVAEMQDEFHWRERMRAANCGVFNREQADRLLFRFRDKVLQARMMARRYEQEAYGADNRGKVYPTASGRTYWTAQAAVLRRTSEELQRSAEEWGEIVKNLEAMLAGNLEA